MRRKVIAGNWKMNKTPIETVEYLKVFMDLIKESNSDIILCVPYVDILVALELTKNTNIKIGAQNMHFSDNGAFTGEISPLMLKDMGIEYVILGHSERRTYFYETDEIVNNKIKSALKHGIKPIVCVGETLEQREAGITKKFVIGQVKNVLKDIDSDSMKDVIIAYEPIWAIGTGKTASSDDANEVCTWIRDELHSMYNDLADEIIIQYGGSIKSTNAKELFEMSNIDGGLVGGASLEPEEFAKIINY